jgi:hypothetical protein
VRTLQGIWRTRKRIEGGREEMSFDELIEQAKPVDDSAFKQACNLEEKSPPKKIITVLDHKTGRTGDFTIKEFVDWLNNTYHEHFKAYVKL